MFVGDINVESVKRWELMGRSRYAAVLVAGVAAALVAGGAHADAAAPEKVVRKSAQLNLPEVHTLVASTFTPAATPVRVLDTRDGTGGVAGPVGQGQSITLDLTTQVPADATAVILNVTGTSPTSTTFVTVYPAGTAVPNASNQNLVRGQTRPNGVSVQLGTIGATGKGVSLFNAVGSTHLIADLAGWYASSTTGSKFTAQSPKRVLDTRVAPGPVGPGGTVAIDFSGLPAAATAVTFNLTGVNATAGTFVTAFPSGTTRPNASNLNLLPGEVAPNLVTVKLGADKKVLLFNAVGSVHLIADLAGFYATDQGNAFYPVDPQRVMDTRPGNGLDPSVVIELSLGGLPLNTSAVVGNLTGTTVTAEQFVVAWPSFNDPIPEASNLNLSVGQIAPNLITVAMGPTADPNVKTIAFANNNGYVDLILDVAGVFAP